ncbi:MAG: hypothetical protein V9G11_07335 [Bifidobacterium adolescentis]
MLQNLTKAFDQIYSSITSSAKIKVFSITDTLSQWVDPVDFAGVANGADITQYVTVKNGSTTLTSGYTATYSVDQFRQSHGDGDVQRHRRHRRRERLIVIDVSFKVKPSDAAYANLCERQPAISEYGRRRIPAAASAGPARLLFQRGCAS